MEKRAIVLLIGSVKSSKYKEARLKVLSEGYKPVIVRVPDSTIIAWIKEMQGLELDFLGENKFIAKAVWLDSVLPEGLTRDSVRAVVTAVEHSLPFNDEFDLSPTLEVKVFIELTFPDAKKVTHWSVDLDGYCNPT